MCASQPIVLLVEDNPGDIFLLRLAFKRCGVECSIEVAQNGEEAISYLTRSLDGTGSRPTHILLDMNLPVRSGLDVLAWIREQPALRGIPVVATSGSWSQVEREQAYRLGIDAVFRKAGTANEVVENVRHITRLWQLSSDEETAS